jgi:hypothetical protein
MPRVLDFYSNLHSFFGKTQSIKNKRHNFIFIGNSKNPINDNIYLHLK